MKERVFLGWLLAVAIGFLPHAAQAAQIDWTGPIAWKDWAVATKDARKHKKSICLVVFAHWCPHCRELVPAFKDPEVVKLSRNLVMVVQDADLGPAWLQERFGKYGGYVPRVFFLHPDGTVAEEIVSGHTRFPYFYQPQKLGQLRVAMRTAAGLKGHGR